MRPQRQMSPAEASQPRSVPPVQTFERTTQTGLVRGIGRWGLVGLTINFTVGAGIFGLPARIYGLTGVWSVLAYLVCAGLVTLITLCFAEVSSRFAETGGPYLYARSAFGSVIGFEVGWLLWLARLTAFSALCNLLLGYLSYFWPAAASGWTRTLVITGVLIGSTTVNLIGVREASIVSNIFTIAKIAPLLLFIFAGLFFVKAQPFTEPVATNYSSFSTAVLLLIFAYSGFEMATMPGGEIRDPKRQIPFALLTATGVVALLYVMVQVVAIGTLPGLASSERPLVDASSRFLGVAGASILSVGALISVSGTLSSAMLVAPRVLFAMAEQGQLPRFFAATHRRFRTPHIAILVTAAAMLVLTLQGSFISALTVSTMIRLVQYIATCVALPVLRLRNDTPSPRFTAPAGVAIAVVATLLSLWLLSNSPASEARASGLLAALGLVVFFFWRKLGKADQYRNLSPASAEEA